MSNFISLGEAGFEKEEDALNWALGEWEADKTILQDKRILVVGAQYPSCAGSGFFLLQDKNNGELYEVHGGHCSCHGFEGQFNPEKTTIEYLLSDKFSFYDLGGDDEKEKFQNFVRGIK